MSQRFGKLPFADLLAPAIDIAERGYAVPVVVQHKWQLAFAVKELVSQPGFADVFLPRGRAPAGRRAVAHARRGRRRCGPIASTRGEAFYRGEIAQAHRAPRPRRTAAR